MKAYRGETSGLANGLNLMLHRIYLAFYAIGISTELWFTLLGRILGAFLREGIWDNLCRFVHWLPRALLRVLKWLLRELFSPVVVLITAGKNIGLHLRAAFRRSRREGVACLFASFFYFIIQIFKSLLRLLNFVAPAVAIYLLTLTIQYYSTVDYALAIKYDGYSIGYVSDLSVYDDAKSMLGDRLASIQLDPDEVRDCAVSYTVVFVPSTSLATPSDLCDQMIQKSISNLTVAYGVYVDGNYWGAIKDGERLKTYLDDRLSAAVTAMNTVPTVEDDVEDPDMIGNEENFRFTGEVTARFLRDIQVTEGYFPREGLVDDQPFYSTFDSVVSGQKVYVVEAGDSTWGIVQKLEDVSMDELYALNPWMETETIYPGDEIVISNEVPYLEVQLMAKVTYDEDVAPEIERVESSSYYVGYAKVTDSGTPGVRKVTANVVYQNGVEVGREVLSQQTVSDPIPGKMIVGTKDAGYDYVDTGNGSSAPTESTGSFMWPVDGGYVSCGYGGYYGHRGMDIAAPEGTNIRASDSGLVEVSVRNDSIGYGNYVVINHGNGYKTLYAHCSARYVKAGDYVNKGDIIAAVGETGWAYGNHCHFEIWVNGVKVNPAKYVY